MNVRHLKIVAHVLLLLFFGVESGFAKHAQKGNSTVSSATKNTSSVFDLEISSGYRIDKLNWSIAGGGINILSELSWEDLMIRQYKIGGRLTRPYSSGNRPYTVYVRSAISYGKIVGGENQDSDYNGNDRTLEFSRSNNDANDGNVLDGTLGAGFQEKIRLEGSRWTLGLAPLIGYSYHEQNLKMTNGFQTIDTRSTVPQLGFFPGLNSTYETEWKGPWLGLDLTMDDGNKNTFFSSIEYHWRTSYLAKANWNLRKSFEHPVSFTHEATGSGLVASLAWSYLIRRNISINTTLEYQRWTTKAGIDTTFLSKEEIARLATEENIITDGAIQTRFNQANWESRSFSLGLQFHF